MPYTITFHCHTEQMRGYQNLYGLTISVSVDLAGAPRPPQFQQVLPWQCLDSALFYYRNHSKNGQAGNFTLLPLHCRNATDDYASMITNPGQPPDFYQFPDKGGL